MWLSQHPHLKLKNCDSLLSSKAHKGDLPLSQCWGTLALKSQGFDRVCDGDDDSCGDGGGGDDGGGDDSFGDDAGDNDDRN